MTIMNRVALAGVFALGLASAAHADPAQIPTPANPYPANPVATDGTPLARPSYGDTLYRGRSAGFGGPIGSLVDGAAGIAGGAVDTGLGVAGTAVGGSVNAAGQVVR